MARAFWHKPCAETLELPAVPRPFPEYRMTRILVVDDDRPQAAEYGVLLRHAGCEVTVAGNGREAMDLLRHDVPDVVLTDLDMPEMDGLELVQAIRRDYPAL